MNVLDQFVKHDLKVKHYARYTDDFLIISSDHSYLRELLPRIESFLREKLRLELHPQKVSIRPYHQGIDFLGYVTFPHHSTVRTTTRRRMFRKLEARTEEYGRDAISEESLLGSLRSYLGMLSHADTHTLREELLNKFWLWRSF